MVAWVAWVLMDEREQKVGSRGCEGFRPIVGHREGKSQKCVFRLFSHSRPRWHALRTTHIPRRPKKKPLRGKKVGFAEKKRAYRKKWRIVCIKGGMSLLWWLATTDPLEAHCFGFAVSRLRLSLANCPRYTISDGRFFASIVVGGDGDAKKLD